jgi:hypothetical protein
VVGEKFQERDELVCTYDPVQRGDLTLSFAI